MHRSDDSGVQTLIDDAVAGVDITSDNAGVAAAAEQAACEAANGTWDGSVCAPAAVPYRDCFLVGACGLDGWDYGAYEGEDEFVTGCVATNAAPCTRRVLPESSADDDRAPISAR